MAMIACIKATVGETPQGLETDQVPFQSLGYEQDLERVLLGLSGEIGVEDLSEALAPIERFYPDLSAGVNSGEGIESELPLYIGTRIMYWYHPDYVSNVDMVTDKSGEAYELFLYNAWGESLHHWSSSSTNSWSSPYRFNSKELDSETGMHYYGARYHHPKLSVWMSVDPYTAKTQESYQYTGNNPIALLDADGNWPYTIFINSFHPWPSFGGNGNPENNYGGDNRPFSTNPETASSRIHHQVKVNNVDDYIDYSKKYTRSDESTHPIKGVKTADPYGWAFLDYGSESLVRVTTGYSASNPFLWYAPYIDVSAVVMITENQDNTIRLQAKVFGDNFPNTELSIGDNKGQVLLVGTDVRASGNDDLPKILFGGASTQIMDIDLMIRIDNEGNFTHVFYEGNWISVKTYNAIQREKDPNAYD
jgi:RHS repeat-associated protein